MEIAFVIFGILALSSFLEAKHLSNNKIRNDEDVYYALCVICLLIMLGMAIFDGKEILKMF